MIFSSLVLNLLKSSQWTFSQASTTPWSQEHRPRVICLMIAPEESLEAVRGVGQPPSQANCQHLEFPKCHLLSAAKTLLTENVEFLVH